MKKDDPYRRRVCELLDEAAATEDAIDRSRLIWEAVSWHAKGQAAQRALERRTPALADGPIDAQPLGPRART